MIMIIAIIVICWLQEVCLVSAHLDWGFFQETPENGLETREDQVVHIHSLVLQN